MSELLPLVAYKRADGMYEMDGIAYRSAEELVQGGIFGFCCCGRFGGALRYVREALEHIESIHRDDRSWDEACAEWNARTLEIHGNEQAAYFFYWWADSKEYTEHGGSVPGWLTDNGHRLVDLIREVEELPEEAE